LRRLNSCEQLLLVMSEDPYIAVHVDSSVGLVREAVFSGDLARVLTLAFCCYVFHCGKKGSLDFNSTSVANYYCFRGRLALGKIRRRFVSGVAHVSVVGCCSRSAPVLLFPYTKGVVNTYFWLAFDPFTVSGLKFACDVL